MAVLLVCAHAKQGPDSLGWSRACDAVTLCVCCVIAIRIFVQARKQPCARQAVMGVQFAPLLVTARSQCKPILTFSLACLAFLTPAGPTVVIDQEYDNATKKVYPDNPTACVLVWPRAAHYCVFDGALGHGVLDTCSQVQRVTFLVNWWRTRPQVWELGSKAWF